VTRRLLLVRHCESSGPAPDAPLTGRGHEQARTLATQLAPLAPDHIVSSPFERARQSVAPLAAALELAVAIEPRLAERRLGVDPFGDWRQGLRASFADLDRSYPDGESARTAQQRGRAAVEEVLRGAHRLPVLATHGNLLSLLLASIDGRFGYGDWEQLANPDVFVLTIAGDAWSYARWSGAPLELA
jgi:2,3-bisphosphoglycerate-dependent phosphoglycerate mutase